MPSLPILDIQMVCQFCCVSASAAREENTDSKLSVAPERPIAVFVSVSHNLPLPISIERDRVANRQAMATPDGTLSVVVRIEA